MGFWKKLFGGKKNPHSNISQRGESVRRNIYETVSIAPADQVRLIELEAEIRKMAEPKLNGIETKEYYAHMGAQVLAGMMTVMSGDDVELTDHDFTDLTKRVADIERQDLKGSTFKFPWPERIKRLKE